MPHYGFRFPDDIAEALNNYAKQQRLTRSEAVLHLLATALHNAPVEQVEPVEQREQIQELIDAKTAYLANGLNDVKHSLESEIEALKVKMEALETRLGEY